MKLEGLCLLILCLSFVVTGTSARYYGTVQQPNDDEIIGHKIDDDDDDGSNIHDGDDDDYGGFNADDDQGKTIDEIIVEATNDAHGFDSMDTVNSSDPKNRLVNIEYDMVFTEEELEELSTESSKDKRAAATINGARGGYRWTNNHIPFEFAPNTFTAYDKNVIIDGMKTWEKYTCLTFAHSTSGNRIQFYNGKGCTSHIGMKGGTQLVSLAPACRVKSVILHEVGHAIGLQHEHQRPDRDSYVQIITKNVQEKLKPFFKKRSWNVVKNMGIKYDYLSIMHYGARAFSKNKGTTIETKDSAYQSVIGKRKSLSFRDIKTVNVMLKCAEANKCKLRDGNCPGEGFVGKDCKCWCPGDPYKLCDMNGNAGKYCQDDNTNCPKWGKAKHCTNSSYKKYMTMKCRKTCGLCTAVKTCTDENKNCPAWAKRGECKKNPRYMLTKCKTSCTLCKKQTSSNILNLLDANFF